MVGEKLLIIVNVLKFLHMNAFYKPLQASKKLCYSLNGHYEPLQASSTLCIRQNGHYEPLQACYMLCGESKRSLRTSKSLELALH